MIVKLPYMPTMTGNYNNGASKSSSFIMHTYVTLLACIFSALDTGHLYIPHAAFLQAFLTLRSPFRLAYARSSPRRDLQTTSKAFGR